MSTYLVTALERMADAIEVANERGDVDCRGTWRQWVLVTAMRATELLLRIHHTPTLCRWHQELGWKVIEVTRWRVGDGPWMTPQAFVAAMERQA